MIELGIGSPLDLRSLLAALAHPGVVWEFGALALAIGLAWGLVRLMRGRDARPGSIWFGENIVDGVLFPALALAAAFGARLLLAGLGHATGLFRLALPLLVSLLAIRFGVRVLRVAFPASPLVRVIERTLSWLVWGWLGLWITGLLPLVLDQLGAIGWTLGGAHVTLRNLIEGALSAAVVLVVALWLSAAIEARLLKEDEGRSLTHLSVRKMAANAVRALLLFVGLLMALSAAGIDLTALSVLGGAVGVGIGFGLQKLASNYVSGFVILAERSVRIGDTVKVDNFEGRITDINTRYTVIRALNGRESIVPNELLITQRVENSSLADPKVLLHTLVSVAYGTDLDALMPALVATMAAVPRVLQEPGPGVLLENFGADGLELRLNFWIADPQNGQGNVRSEVNLAVLRLLQAMGVEIPFPQRVVRTIAPSGPAAPGA